MELIQSLSMFFSFNWKELTKKCFNKQQCPQILLTRKYFGKLKLLFQSVTSLSLIVGSNICCNQTWRSDAIWWSWLNRNWETSVVLKCLFQTKNNLRQSTLYRIWKKTHTSPFFDLEHTRCIVFIYVGATPGTNFWVSASVQKKYFFSAQVETKLLNRFDEKVWHTNAAPQSTKSDPTGCKEKISDTEMELLIQTWNLVNTLILKHCCKKDSKKLWTGNNVIHFNWSELVLYFLVFLSTNCLVWFQYQALQKPEWNVKR